MEGLITALQGILSLDTFMAAFTDLVPIIGTILIFSFVYGIVRKLIKGAQKGKARI